jgi:ribosomal protein S18 acetylase RimI-like enzyme
MFPSLPQVVIRQATSQDISMVSRFIDQTILVHRNLDWQPLIEWVPREPFLLRFDNGKLRALFSCAPDPEGVAWIHAFATDHWSSEIHKIWQSLLEPALEELKKLNSNIYSVALNDWYYRLLLETGFRVKQNIVVLSWQQTLPPPLPLPPDVLIRPMEPADLDQVAEIDQRAFDHQWSVSRVSLDHVYLNAAHATVAEAEDEIIAYELSTATYFTAHLTRLAVEPSYQQANIGHALTRNMLAHFHAQEINQITVNTQDDNAASIGLYQKLGFKLTGESFPVFWLDLAS